MTSSQPSRQRKLQAIALKFALFAVALVLQFALLSMALIFLSEQSHWFVILQVALSIAVLIGIATSDMAPEYKLPWAVVIVVAPLVGGMIYLLFGRAAQRRSVRKKLDPAQAKTARELAAAPGVIGLADASLVDEAMLDGRPVGGAGLPGPSRYLSVAAGFPAFRDSDVEYFPQGEQFLDAMMDAIESAQRYIFFEYFIIAGGSMWDELRGALVRKAAQGVEICVMYDDLGSAFVLPQHFETDLRAHGIHVHVVNPLGRQLGLLWNSRNHRKILVVDGHTAFTGGVNIADEYVNRITRFGHWKDTGVRVVGPAAWSFAVMFLSLWDVVAGPGEWDRFRPFEIDAAAEEMDGRQTDGATCEIPERGIVQPFDDTPFDRVTTGADTYLNLIEAATRTLDIMTPYLILDFRTRTAITRAAQRGVRVRIVTPGIPDKPYVLEVTRSFYGELILAGVEIYEYTPGFLHAKACVADGEQAVVGTINVDFRSFYLNQECGLYLYRVSAIAQISADVETTVAFSARVDEKKAISLSVPRRLLRTIYRLFAPLL